MNASARSLDGDRFQTLRSLAEEAVRVHVTCEEPAEGAVLFARLSELGLPLRLSLTPLAALELEPAPDLFVASAPCAEPVVRRLGVAALRFPYPEVLFVGEGVVSTTRGRRSGYQLGAPRHVSESELEVVLDEVVRCLVPLKRVVASLVGRMPLKDVQRVVRSVMVLEALSRGHGSRRLAARALGVTRPAVQQMLAGFSVSRALRS